MHKLFFFLRFIAVLIILGSVAVKAQDPPADFNNPPNCIGSRPDGAPQRCYNQRGNVNITVLNQKCTNRQLLSTEYRTTIGSGITYDKVEAINLSQDCSRCNGNGRILHQETLSDTPPTPDGNITTIEVIRYDCRGGGGEICNTTSTVTRNCFTEIKVRPTEIARPGGAQHIARETIKGEATPDGNGCQFQVTTYRRTFQGGNQDGKVIDVITNKTTCTVVSTRPTKTSVVMTLVYPPDHPNRPSTSSTTTVSNTVNNPDGGTTITKEETTRTRRTLQTIRTIPSGPGVCGHRGVYGCCSKAQNFSCCNLVITNTTEISLNGRPISTENKEERNCQRCGGTTISTKTFRNGATQGTDKVTECSYNTQTQCTTTTHTNTNRNQDGTSSQATVVSVAGGCTRWLQTGWCVQCGI